MQPWKAELRPTEGISREAGLAWQCPAMEWAALEAVSNLFGAKPARADVDGISFLGRCFMTNDLGQNFTSLWVSW